MGFREDVKIKSKKTLIKFLIECRDSHKQYAFNPKKCADDNEDWWFHYRCVYEYQSAISFVRKSLIKRKKRLAQGVL